MAAGSGEVQGEVAVVGLGCCRYSYYFNYFFVKCKSFNQKWTLVLKNESTILIGDSS